MKHQMTEDFQESTNIAQYLDSHTLKTPDKIFLVDQKSRRTYSFLEFNRMVNSTCRYFRDIGLRKDETIVLYLENSPEFCILLLAALRYGVVAMIYPAILVPTELKRDLSLISCSVLFTKKKHMNAFKDDEGLKIIFLDELDDLFHERHKDVAGNEPLESVKTEMALLYYSAGASGDPRGIFYTHRNLVSLIPSICRGFHFSDVDRHLITLPLSHSAALNYSFFPALMCGATIILAEGFWEIREEFWNICRTHEITYVEVVPTILYMLLHLPGEPDSIDTLRYVGCGSAPLDIDLQNDFEKRFGLPVANLYGLTETGPTHVDYPIASGWKRGSIGKPLDINQVVILDNQGRECPPGTEGEIAVKGDNLFPGYALDSKTDSKRFFQGFLRTGDRGFRDENGVFYFCGLYKELIIKGGFNIHPDEINEILRSHPMVDRCRTIGVPDMFFGERIRSWIVLLTEGLLTAEELKKYCLRYLSPIKVPDEIIFTTELPGR